MSPRPPAELPGLLAHTRTYLQNVLLPFWIERAPDREHGGFLTYFDAHGRPTGETDKTLLMQLRMVFALSRAHRAGHGGGACARLAREGARFLLEHGEDREHGGWFWILDRRGTPLVDTKVGYGQCFAMYAFAELYRATGDEAARAALERTLDVVLDRMSNREHGGFLEILQRDWTRERTGPHGGDRKSFDVHMHMMEALTNVVLATGSPRARDALADVVAILTGRMLDPVHGTGIAQFALDFTPRPAILLAVQWGRDEGRSARAPTPVGFASYGHDVEFAWLLLEAADALGVARERYRDVVVRLCDHCVRHGIDHELGGVFVEGPAGGDPTSGHKQFWQQAEVLVGMLAAFELAGDERYWDAFTKVHRFVFEHFVHLAGGGEWFALVDRDGTPLWDYLGDAWKISYHTVRSMVEVVERLGRWR